MFPHLSVLENVRIALQSKLGNSYSFWRSEASLNPLDDQARVLLAQVDLEGHADVVAVDLSYGRKRGLELATPPVSE